MLAGHLEMGLRIRMVVCLSWITCLVFRVDRTIGLANDQVQGKGLLYRVFLSAKKVEIIYII